MVYSGGENLPRLLRTHQPELESADAGSAPPTHLQGDRSLVLEPSSPGLAHSTNALGPGLALIPCSNPLPLKSRRLEGSVFAGFSMSAMEEDSLHPKQHQEKGW